MDDYIARANIDRYIELLDGDDTPPGKRSTITRLLIEEEDKLSRDLEQLEFAESKVALCRNRVKQLKYLRDSFAEGSVSQIQADSLLVSFEAVLTQVESFCGHMRKRVEQNGL